MRRVEVTAPHGRGRDVAAMAFGCGIGEVSVVEKEFLRHDSPPVKHDVVDMNVSTPHANAFVGELQRAPFFNREEYRISVREPRANLTAERRREITRPVPAPIVDIDQELWQFSHVTYSF